MLRAVRIAGALLGAFVMLSSVSKAAWVETRVKGHTGTVDIERNGVALVTHELLIGVRGGPLKQIEVPGVDLDAEPEGIATATPIVRYGVPTPIPLLVAKGEDGTLRLEVEHEKGLRTGSYAVIFRYKTQLLARDRIRRRGTSAQVEWIGPRFPDGIDAAKVRFRLPEGPTLPVLPSADDADDAAVMGSAFLSSIRHEEGKVEVEVVRPHVAQGEPAVWRLLASPKCFDGLAETLTETARPAGDPVIVERPRERAFGGLMALAVALAYGLLVAVKWSLAKRDAKCSAAEPRALLPLPIGMRAALSGSCLAGALAVGVVGDYPTAATTLLLAALLLAALAPPRLLAAPRGPGQWLALHDDDAFVGRNRPPAGRFLDAGSAPGLLILCLALGAGIAGAVVLAGRSPYHALGLLLSLSCLLPIFGTGRGIEWPKDRPGSSRRELAACARILRARHALKVVAWARIPDGGCELDELRLLLRVQGAREGLVSVELAMAQHASSGGFCCEPLVLVRAREGSECHHALGRGVRWQRGRSPHERVALLRPSLPLRSVFIAMVSETLAMLSRREAFAPSGVRLGGSGVSGVDSKLRVASPAHAA